MVDIPEPKPGLVIRFAYLWRDERDSGRDEGSKDRPTAVVMTFEEKDGRKRVAVVPVTHSKPDARSGAYSQTLRYRLRRLRVCVLAIHQRI